MYTMRLALFVAVAVAAAALSDGCARTAKDLAEGDGRCEARASFGGMADPSATADETILLSTYLDGDEAGLLSLRRLRTLNDATRALDEEREHLANADELQASVLRTEDTVPLDKGAEAQLERCGDPSC